MRWLDWLALTLPLTLAVEVAAKPPLGVPPERVSKYVAVRGTWKCLDGSKEIPWKAVNDDYCDCPDGSDEPGTSACANNTFYCRNEGHIGSTIPSSRVNDGLCEPECCDGSDEASGVCPNSCKTVGEEYRKKADAERKLRKTGAKLRSNYIAFAQKEKKRLEGVIHESAQEIVIREKEVARLKETAERTESLSAAALERKKQSPFYNSLLTHHNALKSLQREHKKALDRTKALEEILTSLRSGYNPNYQDMAVLEAVRGWEEMAGLKHIGTEEDEAGSDGDEEEKKEEEELEEGMWSKEELESDLDSLLGTDYVGLLLEHDQFTDASPYDSLLFDLSSYIPDSLMPGYVELKTTALGYLELLGIVKEASNSGAVESTQARKDYEEAEHSLTLTRQEKQSAEQEYADLFDVEGYGKEGEWKKLDKTCLKTISGDYTYEVCLFDEARQIPNKGGTTFSLGKFDSWNKEAEIGSPAYYSKQSYTSGTKCWNGPHRSVQFVMTCGTENALLSVMELEKCEYQFTGTSPALCLPLDEAKKDDGAHEEL